MVLLIRSYHDTLQFLAISSTSRRDLSLLAVTIVVHGRYLNAYYTVLEGIKMKFNCWVDESSGKNNNYGALE